MKNFQVTDKDSNKQYWISRSIAVVVVIYTVDPFNNTHVIAEKRGPGCPDFVGYWALPCGYLDFDETLEQCAIREVLEEIGLDLSKYSHLLAPVDINSDPLDDIRQNVTVRFVVPIPWDEIKDFEFDFNSDARGGETLEVEDCRLIPMFDLDLYLWAWNHNNVIRKLVQHVDR